MRVLSSADRALLVLGLGLIVAMTSGCPGDEKECEVAADCGEEGQWTCTEEGTCQAVEIDLCEGVTCPGGQTCNEETGDCAGQCCTLNTCLHNPLADCDEELCLESADDSSIDPCVVATCDPACAGGFVCDRDTLECVPVCLTEGCEEAYERCDADPDSSTYGQCVQRPISEGEVGWPCHKDPTVCLDGNYCGGPFYDPDDPEESWIGWCTRDCFSDSECPVGSFCDGGVCWVICDAEYYNDCPFGTQCVDDIGRPHPTCIALWEVSECEGAGCLPEFSVCEEADDCARGLTCDLGFCMRLDCAFTNAACNAGDLCFQLGYNTSGCFKGCDPTVLESCPAEGLSCSLGIQLDTFWDSMWEARTSAECTAAGYAYEENDPGSEYGYLCYLPCPEDGCPAGQMCLYGLCVNYGIIGGACSEGGCDPFDCSDYRSGGKDYSVCHGHCATDADCDEAVGGVCRRFEFTSTSAMQVCTYETAGAYCWFECESDGDCGYCASDDDCGTFRDERNEDQNLRCDLASNTCVRPASANNASTMCREGQGVNPAGLLQEDGSTTGACATACQSDLNCTGPCVNGYCKPVTELCNSISGQCEPRCESDGTCLYDTCVHGRCVVGCDDDGDCGSSGVATCRYEDRVSYCIVSDCESSEECDEGWTCDDGLCIPPSIDCTISTQGEVCGGETPYCNEDTGECVAMCLVNENCADGETCVEGVCTGTEVDCTIENQDEVCGGETPYCDEDTGECVAGCLVDDNCTEQDLSYCNVDTGVCQECTHDDHCIDGDCSAEGTCVDGNGS